MARTALGLPGCVLLREAGQASSAVAVADVARDDDRLHPEPDRIIAPFENNVGWAYVPYPGVSRKALLRDLGQMQQLGANTVYLSHNNPGDADAAKAEPGLSFAIYYALRNHTPSERQAAAIFRAIVAALEVARQLGLRVVLPIGYQIEMGPEWNAQHPDALRRQPDGGLLTAWSSEPTASPYAPAYQAHIAEYYRWVDSALLARFPNICAVNLADEPIGADYSPWAQAVFRDRYGVELGEADPVIRGLFLSEFIADYASLAAQLWAEVNSIVPGMMTFHFERDRPWVPNIESIFRKTPETFIVSADTHLHDAPPEMPLTDEEIDQLYGLVRTLAYLSSVYTKTLMLWTSANAWGLTDQGGLDQALLNLEIVYQTAREGGAWLGMLMAWAWNVEGQGAYRCDTACAFDPEEVVPAVSAAMAALQETLSTPARPSVRKVLYLPAEELYRRIGLEQVDSIASAYVDLQAFSLRTDGCVYLTDGLALNQALDSGLDVVTVL